LSRSGRTTIGLEVQPMALVNPHRRVSAQDLEPLLRKARLDAASLARLKIQTVDF
jgi:hypothetical protein